MRRRIFPEVVCLLAVFLILTPSCAKRTYLGLNAIEKMNPNGHYVVYVLQGSRWQQAGELSFDRFFREREMDLSPFLFNERTIRIRLTQKGGGAAHLDNVSLGRMPPIALEGTEDVLALQKVSRKDFDVIDAFGKTVEFSFPQSGQDKILSLTARVEGKRVDDTPFQFPIENLYRPMDEKARFYEYNLNSHRASLLKDGNLAEICSKEPFFVELSPTGTGHPAGYTYGWVSNDDENLYVTIDFTPDNTMDGDKDYAKVHVKTEADLKEFKVSVDESSWGTAHFTYTDNVLYQHKLYNIKIPLKELEIEHEDKEQSLRLAFSAYGTAGPGHTPFIAYDPQNHRYLVVYVDTTAGSQVIYARLTDDEGRPLGSEIVISDAAYIRRFARPSVAYDSVNGRFLVVWGEERDATTGYDIYGQLVNANGTLYKTVSNVNFVISDNDGSQFRPSAAYDSVNERFLVVWSEEDRAYTTTGPDIYGQLVNANGTLYKTVSNVNFIISNNDYYQGGPSVAYDSVNGRFLVVWPDGRTYNTTGSYDIYGQLVNANGTLYKTVSNVNFATSDNDGYQSDPSVAYDSVNGRFLVVWHDRRDYATTSGDIYGQLVNANGTLHKTVSNVNFVISNNDSYQGSPSAVYDSVNGRFLVVWGDNRNYTTTGADIYGQRVNANGTLHNTISNVNFVISNAESDQAYPSLAYNSNEASFLVAFTDYGYPPDIGFVFVGSEPFPWELFYPAFIKKK